MKGPLVACAYCEEVYHDEEFTRVEGWWVKPYPDIEWDGTFEGMPSSIFTADRPEAGVAFKCPNGCIQRQTHKQSRLGSCEIVVCCTNGEDCDEVGVACHNDHA